MALRPNFPRIAALATIAAVVVTLFSIADGEGGPVPPRVRPNPNIVPFQGLGTWVDIYDASAWKHPAAAVADMAAHGVRTLYLQTSNFSHPTAFVDEGGVTAFVDAAHADGVQIVAWYLPSFVNVATDAQRCEAAIRFRTSNGNGFDGFGLDIESADVANASLRSQRLLALSAQLRTFAGETYPLGAIIPSPRGIVVHKDYWPGFPYAGLAEVYDVLMPMSYFTWHHPTGDSTHLYLTQNIRIIRREVGSDQVPIHVIGGIAQDASLAQAQAFVDVLRERGVIGGSYYVPGHRRKRMARAATDPGERRPVARDAGGAGIRRARQHPRLRHDARHGRRLLGRRVPRGSHAHVRRVRRAGRRDHGVRELGRAGDDPRRTDGRLDRPAAALDPRRPARRRPDQHDRVRAVGRVGYLGRSRCLAHEDRRLTVADPILDAIRLSGCFPFRAWLPSSHPTGGEASPDAIRLARVVAVACLAFFATACSVLLPKHLDTKGLEPNLAQQFDAQFSVTGVTVVCPSGIKAEAGGTFQCTATLTTGDTVTLLVTQVDANGQVNWKPVGASTPTPSASP